MEDKSQYPTYVVLGSGGHTAEMCEIIKSLFDNLPRAPDCYFIVAKTDDTSRKKVEETLDLKTKPHFVEIPRSRHVNQSYLTSIFTTLWALLYCFYILLRDKPKMVLCNGPGTCVPICLVAALYRFLHILHKDTKIVFVESFCRVNTLSLTGKILLPITDTFVVQWEPLARNRKNVKYFGPLV
ncbi:UDP-N-acetylglucosamine transferase subunit ALG14 homolog [Episyrphus balteatus]|uniref:UDP-N-acetylglucosamine transferase subunit ALG14 homolog n=1 Tax=Episyrphus balteatus TaxID=286459 RepID=UPI002485D34F|nr:UDP-N-acetylglucosamine transferase subunit ALG14 homolog [Episyrphus balteatus]